MYSGANGDWSRDNANTRNCSVKSGFKYANTVDDVSTSETLSRHSICCEPCGHNGASYPQASIKERAEMNNARIVLSVRDLQL